MKKLRRDAEALAPVIAALECVERPQQDDSSYSFCVFDKTKTKFQRIVCHMMDPDSYPSTACFLSAEDASDKLQDDLNGLCERFFSDSAPLRVVVQKVLELFGHSDAAQQVARPPAGQPDDAVMAEPGDGVGSDAAMDEAGGSEFGGDSEDMGGSDDGSSGGGDDFGAEDEEEERLLTIECGTRMGRWERCEKALEEKQKAKDAAAESAAGMSSERAAAAKRQIFDPREAFLMLSKELLELFRAQSAEVFVDSVGDDVYSWAVELAAFARGSGLAQDMEEVRRRYSYSSVRFNIHFMRGLHPFFPATVELVRPHFRDWVLGAAASHPMLHQANWDPWRRQAELIEQVKAFLEAAARVDLSSPYNDIARFPASSYPPSQRHLARLEALTGVAPLCVCDPGHKVEAAVRLYEARDTYARDSARLDALAAGSEGSGGKKRSREAGAGAGAGGEGKEKEGGKEFWARGTGYGHGDRGKSEVWDARAAEAAQRAHDDELRRVMAALARAIAREMGPRADAGGGSDGAGGAGPGASGAGGEGTNGVGGGSGDAHQALLSLLGPEEVDEVTGEGAGEAADAALYPPNPPVCLGYLAASCLLPVLVREIKRTSFSDMCGRTEYFTALLRLVRELCRPECGGPLLARRLPEDCEGGASLAGAVAGLATPAAQYVRLTRRTLEGKVEEEARLAGLVATTSSAAAIVQLKSVKESTRDLRATMRLAVLVSEVVAASARCTPAEEPGAAGGSGGAAGDAGGSSSGEAAYCAALRPLQVDEVSGLWEAGHTYGAEVRRESVAPSERVTRLGREIAGLASDLPLSASSSVFVRVDDEKMIVWRALIVGPEDTPYCAGCFVFDIYFPPTYPSVPPQVKLKTTGGGTVRFNPNLYNDGKVCLSLLGTWAGGRGEGWSPGLSTALQVFVSIQSLIMVPDPYFNEPGYESKIGTNEGKNLSRGYNAPLREKCIQYAMVEQLRHPPPELEAVIRTHFRLRKAYVVALVDKWITEARGWSSTHAAALEAQKAALVAELNKL